MCRALFRVLETNLKTRRSVRLKSTWDQYCFGVAAALMNTLYYGFYTLLQTQKDFPFQDKIARNANRARILSRTYVVTYKDIAKPKLLSFFCYLKTSHVPTIYTGNFSFISERITESFHAHIGANRRKQTHFSVLFFFNVVPFMFVCLTYTVLILDTVFSPEEIT